MTRCRTAAQTFRSSRPVINMLISSLAAASDVGVVLRGQVSLMMVVLHLVMVLVLTCASLPLPDIVVDLVLLADNMDALLLLIMMVMRRLIVDKVPTAHAQMLTVGIRGHARLSVAHETRWRVSERVNLAGPLRRHIEWVVCAANAATYAIH